MILDSFFNAVFVFISMVKISMLKSIQASIDDETTSNITLNAIEGQNWRKLP